MSTRTNALRVGLFPRLLLLLVFATGAPGARAASPGSRQIAEYLGAADGVLHGARQALAKADADSNQPGGAEMAAFMRDALKYADPDEITELAASSFDRSMTPAEIETFVAFIATPLGRRAGTTLRAHPDGEDLGRAVAADYSAEEQAALDRFFGSPAVRHARAGLVSAEWKRAWAFCGETLACRHVAHAMPDRLPMLREKGKCLTEAASGEASPTPVPSGVLPPVPDAETGRADNRI